MVSITVSDGMNTSSCETNAHEPRCDVAAPVRARKIEGQRNLPETKPACALPASTFKRPDEVRRQQQCRQQLSVLVFPDPEGPRRRTNSPGTKSKSISCRTRPFASGRPLIAYEIALRPNADMVRRSGKHVRELQQLCPNRTSTVSPKAETDHRRNKDDHMRSKTRTDCRWQLQQYVLVKAQSNSQPFDAAGRYRKRERARTCSRRPSFHSCSLPKAATRAVLMATTGLRSSSHVVGSPELQSTQ
jgi:hypothetical protein